MDRRSRLRLFEVSRMVAHARRFASLPETLEAGEIMDQERVPTASGVFALQELNGNSDAVTLMRSCPTKKGRKPMTTLILLIVTFAMPAFGLLLIFALLRWLWAGSR